MSMRPLQLLCIGHCCHDKLDGRYILGGTASYVALAARQLGLQPGILTSVGSDFEFTEVFEKQGIPVHYKSAEKTTVFENVYQNGQRIQYLHERAATLEPADVPAPWLSAPLVMFSPIAWEVDFALLRAFPDALKAATIQGWLRERDATNRIKVRRMDWSKLAGLNIVIFSNDDIAGFESAIPEIAGVVDILVMTLGAQGAVLFQNGQEKHFPAVPVKEVDATGAGDVFAASFVAHYAETRDAASAAVFANCAASFIVEGIGTGNLPSREQIMHRVDRVRLHLL